MNFIQKKLLHITLSSEEIKEGSLSREQLERAMFNAINLRCASKQEKAIYIRIMRMILDKAFPA